MIFRLLHEEFEPEMRSLFLNSPALWRRHLTKPPDIGVYESCSKLGVSDLLRIVALWRMCGDNQTRADICRRVCLSLASRCQLKETPPEFAAELWLDALDVLVGEIEMGEPQSAYAETDSTALEIAKANLQFGSVEQVKTGLLHSSELRRAGACMACTTNAHFRAACKPQIEILAKSDGSQLVRRFAVRAIESNMMLPQPANAAEVSDGDVVIETPDGKCDAYFVAPAAGVHAAVLIWPDIFGLRPAFRQMAKRLAESGYSVLAVNPFYRTQKAPTATKGASTPIKDVIPLARSLDADKHMTDAKAFVTWLDAQPQVDTKRRIGTTGYCMGGPIVLRTAATVPDRIGAAATFHGGGLATDKPDSPHLLIPKMKADFLIAVAENDDERDPDAKDTLKKSFNKAGLSAEIEVYPAGHGWCPPDARVYDKEQAEKAWSRLLVLLEKAL